MLLYYLSGILLTAILYIFYFKLQFNLLFLPLRYNGDSILYLFAVKTFFENLTPYVNPNLSLPFSGLYYDYPFMSFLDMTLFFFISFFTNNYIVALNIYIVLTFILIFLITFYISNNMGLKKETTFCVALLYAFVPYHFERAIHHTFLALYFIIPVAVFIIFKILENNTTFFYDSQKDKKDNFIDFVKYLFFIFLVGSSNQYYVFFTDFLLLFAGIISVFDRKNIKSLVNAFIVIFLISSVTILCHFPSISYSYMHGSNTGSTFRKPQDTEWHALKLTQLILPVNNHNIDALKNFKNFYNNTAPLVYENQHTTLGIIGSIGFLMSLFIFFVKDLNFSTKDFFYNVSRLNLICFLFGSIGGFASLFSYVIYSQFRAVNRIFVFIALFSFLLIFKALDNVFNKFSLKNYIRIFLLTLIMIAGFYDIIPKDYHKQIYLNNEIEEFNNDREFIIKIESLLPENSKIYQMPYKNIYDDVPFYNEGSFALIKPYLHSNKLKWSHGAIKGRDADRWFNEFSQKPIKEQLETISLLGFSGIYIDKKAYIDNASSIQNEIEKFTGINPLSSANKNLLFYDMRDYNKKLTESLEKSECENKLETINKSINFLLLYQKGFYAEEKAENNRKWRWSENDSRAVFINRTEKNITINLDFQIQSISPRNIWFNINKKHKKQILSMDKQSDIIKMTLIMRPGVNKIDFHSNMPSIQPANGDTRFLSFCIINLNYDILHEKP